MDLPDSCTFNPQKFLIRPQLLQQFQCIICTEKSINLLRCKSCKKCLCNQCAIDQKTKNNKCPYRCTPNQLEMELIPQLKLEFYCPFSVNCKETLKSVKQFCQHDRECQHISESQKIQQNRKWEFKCNNNHCLEIMLEVYDELIKRRKCSECHQYTITRCMCKKCDQYFCRYCRPLPVYQMKCPIGHQFCKRKVKSLYYRCDICQMSTVMLGLYVYDDFICNFGICEACFADFPTFLEPVEYCVNHRNYCSLIGRKLKLPIQQQIVKQKHRLICIQNCIWARCEWCQKEKMCYKKCEQCNKYYCIQCKKFDVMQNNCCELDHRFQQAFQQVNQQSSVIVSEQEQDSSKINKIKYNKQYVCSKCSRKSDDNSVLLIDDACKVVFCYACIQKIKKQNVQCSYRQVSLEYGTCFHENHTMFFQPALKDCKKQCTNCGFMRKIKFFCGLCPQPKYFCCACIPPKYSDECYCHRKLVKLDDNEDEEDNQKCDICDKVSNLNYECQPCGYVLCGSCFAKNKKVQLVDEGKKQMMKQIEPQSNGQMSKKQQ